MRILFQSDLAERELGLAAVTVADLREWARQRTAHIPPTVLPLTEFDAVHVESLLSAIELGLRTLTDDAALKLAAGLPLEERHARRVREGDAVTARWLLGVNSNQQWRDLLTAAIAAGDLQTFNAITGLPLPDRVPAPSAEAPSDAQPDGARLPWWQTEHDIFEMAQNIGAAIHARRDPRRTASNVNIAKDIATRIADIERRKGRDRPAPKSATVRKALSGWKFKPD